MKKSPITAALAATFLLGAGAAHAQSAVTVYGLIDAAVETYTNANAAGNNMLRMPNLGGGMFPSRLGFRGTEDLGGGLKAIFALENGFAPDTGTQGQGGRLFGRQAWVGMAGSFGQVTLGRNYNMLFWSSLDTDTFGPSQYGLGQLDSAFPNARTDNSIAYKGSFNGLTLGATYSLGRDTSAAGGPAGTNCPGESAANKAECREWSGMVRYDAANWGAVAAYHRMNGGSTAAFGLNTSNRSDTRLHLAAYTKFDNWKIGGGFVSRTNEGAPATPDSLITYLGVAYRFSPAFTLDGQVGRLDVKDSANDTTQFILRGTYELSKRTAIYVAGGQLSNHGTAAVAFSAGGSVGAGLSQSGLITGIKHSF